MQLRISHIAVEEISLLSVSDFLIRETNDSCSIVGCKFTMDANILFCKAAVVREGLRKALQEGISVVDVEVDSAHLVDILNRKCSPPSRVLNVINDNFSLSSSFDDFSGR